MYVCFPTLGGNSLTSLLINSDPARLHRGRDNCSSAGSKGALSLTVDSQLIRCRLVLDEVWELGYRYPSEVLHQQLLLLCSLDRPLSKTSGSGLEFHLTAPRPHAKLQRKRPHQFSLEHHMITCLKLLNDPCVVMLSC